MDQKKDCGELLKEIAGRVKYQAANDTLTFNGSSFSSPKQVVNKLSQKFNTLQERPD